LKNKLAKRIALYAIIFLFLLIDYFSFSSGLSMLEEIRKTDVLKYIFPILYVGILVMGILAVKGNITSLGAWKCFVLLGVLIASGMYFAELKDEPSKIHFLEYELLTLIFFKALELDIKTKLIYLYTIVAIFFLGIIEEIFQSTFPERTFDIYDLKIDLVSSLLMISVFYIFREKDLFHFLKKKK